MDKPYISAKEYLEQIRYINAQIKSLTCQKLALEDAVYSTSAPLSHTPKSPSPDVHRMEGIIVAKLDIEAKIERLSERLAEVHQTVAAVRSGWLGAILTARYVAGKPWKQIADELYISESRVYQLHRDALAAVEQLLNPAAA